MSSLKNFIYPSPHLLGSFFPLTAPCSHPCTSSKISQPLGLAGRYFLSRPARIFLLTCSPDGLLRPKQTGTPLSTPIPESHQPDPCPASRPKAPSNRGSVSRPGPGSQGLRLSRETGRGCSSQPDTGWAGRLPAPVGRTQSSRSAGPRLRGLPSPDPGSRRCRCPPYPSRSRHGLSVSLPWWSPGSHAGRRPDYPLARLPVGPPLPPPPPPPPPLDPHKGDRACALRSAPGPAPGLAHAVRRRLAPRPAPPPTQREGRGHAPVGFREGATRSLPVGQKLLFCWSCLLPGGFLLETSLSRRTRIHSDKVHASPALESDLRGHLRERQSPGTC